MACSWYKTSQSPWFALVPFKVLLLKKEYVCAHRSYYQLKTLSADIPRWSTACIYSKIRCDTEKTFERYVCLLIFMHSSHTSTDRDLPATFGGVQKWEPSLMCCQFLSYQGVVIIFFFWYRGSFTGLHGSFSYLSQKNNIIIIINVICNGWSYYIYNHI